MTMYDLQLRTKKKFHYIFCSEFIYLSHLHKEKVNKMKALGVNFKSFFFLMEVLIWSNSADLKHQPWPTLHVQQPLLCQQLPPVVDSIFQDGHNRISQPTYAVMLILLPMGGGGLCSFPLNLDGHVTDGRDAQDFWGSIIKDNTTSTWFFWDTCSWDPAHTTGKAKSHGKGHL